MLGTDFYLPTIIDFVLIMFISMPYSLPFTWSAVTKACRSIGSSASNTVSSAYLRLLIFTPPTFTHFISYRIISSSKVSKEHNILFFFALMQNDHVNSSTATSLTSLGHPVSQELNSARKIPSSCTPTHHSQTALSH